MGSCMGRGNQYIQLVKVLYCKLLTNGKQLPAFPLEVGPGTKLRSQRLEARVDILEKCLLRKNKSTNFQKEKFIFTTKHLRTM